MEDRLLVYKIFMTLEDSDLNWHGWHWWACRDKWFEKYSPEYIDEVAEEMANIGIIESNKYGNYRRKRKSLKEKIHILFLS